MFNNPFDSFHKTVASAKEEREQLDRLLTISTPVERLVVAAIGVGLVLLLAWLWFGDIPRNVTFDSVLLQLQDGEAEDGHSVRALVWLDIDDENALGSGKSVVLDVAADDGDQKMFTGKITSSLEIPINATIEGVILSEGLKDFGAVVPVDVGLFQIGIKLEDERDIASIMGRKCRIHIQQGRQSPLALLGLRRS